MSFWPRIILLGDSITQYCLQPNGWGAAIAQQVQRKCDIVNRGFSGYNTDNIVNFFNQVIDKEITKNVVFATIFFGANDSCYAGSYSNQDVPVEKYYNNLTFLVHQFKELGINCDSIILISPPPVEAKVWTLRLQSMIEKGTATGDGACDRGNEHTVHYANACQKVAKENGCRYVDLFNGLINKDLAKYLHDGLHLSDEGNSFLAGLLQPHVDALTDHLPVQLPDWKVINNVP